MDKHLFLIVDNTNFYLVIYLLYICLCCLFSLINWGSGVGLDYLMPEFKIIFLLFVFLLQIYNTIYNARILMKIVHK